VHEYIGSHYSPNFDDFLADNSEFHARFGQHDEAVTVAEQNANSFFDILTASSAFIRQVEKAFREYESKADPSQPYASSLQTMRGELGKYVAENLINNVDTLPHHYTIHQFWELFGKELRAQFPEFGEYKLRPSFKSLQGAVRNLTATSSSLRAGLEAYRLELCRKFDLPAAAPLPPRSPEDVFV
jgi:hypothetical protein